MRTKLDGCKNAALKWCKTRVMDVVSTKRNGVLDMARGLGLWMLGVPITVIILIAVFTNFI